MKIPPFKLPAQRTDTDYFTWQGAHELARRIREVWAEAGHEVIPVVQQMEGQQGYVVRCPTLVGGLPIKEGG